MKSDVPLQGAEGERPRCCLACGTPFAAGNDVLGCPVCLFRRVLEPISEGDPGIRGYRPSRPDDGRCDHYEIARRGDGAFDELGRGAMGVTYKAFDLHLRCPVTLKVVVENYVSDESARLRFLREARAAASVRHPNVASVFHLGRTGSSYFYAMEFVEGETLENLIKRSGRLEVKLALEIATQAAAGLAAVHKQNLVHRDIKPSNIMVSLEDGGAVTAKIIDLGLAKACNEAGGQSIISTPGAFVGTPDFASPEQFAGVQVDIRSDLYSLGATLWKMLTGQTPFRGTSAELMYQHLHAPLATGQLNHVPQPVVVLLEVLLEKDPAWRFQNPIELLKAIPTITGAIEARRRISRLSLQKTPSTASRARTRKPPAKLGPKKISVARLPVTGSEVFGREEDIAFLDAAWANQDANVVTIVAWAYSASGDAAEGITYIENGIRDIQASGSRLNMPYFFALKAEALHLANRPFEAFKAVYEAQARSERTEDRCWCAELHRLKGVFLSATGGDQTQIEASFREAIRIAKEQKSVSLEKRAEGTYADYRRQRALGEHRFQLPL